MIELGQLEKHHEEFAKRNTRVVVVSIEDLEKAKATQDDFPHLVVVSDSSRNLAEAMKVIHRESAPDGNDTSAPTTFLVDGEGRVRWTFRSDSVFVRLAPEEVLAALDRYMRAG